MNERSERSRTSGGAKSRAKDDRLGDESAANYQYSPPQRLATPPPVGGFRYKWVVESINGQPTNKHVQAAVHERYERVRCAELPDDVVVDEDRGDGFARTGGLILMRISDYAAEARRKYFEGLTQRNVNEANVLQGVAGNNAVYEDRGSQQLRGADARRALDGMERNAGA
jgi:hypothetical protein